MKQECPYNYIYRDQLLNHNGLMEVPDYKMTTSGTYKSLNPKTRHAVSGQILEFDRPSTTGSIPLCNIYNSPELDNYTPYNVNNGQISYYIDDSIKDAFYSPIYQIPSNTKKINYVDPMSSNKHIML